MREYEIDASQDGRRLDKWLKGELPALPLGLMQKFLRLKKAKINGKSAKADARLAAGDRVQLYIPDEFFEKPEKKRDALLENFRWRLCVLYEDDQVLLADKRPGMIVHPDDREKINTLVTHARAYLYQKGEYDPADPASFPPTPCNRIDRFTGGIVLMAKTREAMLTLNRKIRENQVEKRYLAVIVGEMPQKEGALDNFIVKREGERRVRVSEGEGPGGQRAVTRYRTLEARGGLSLVECELLTGRTHQIRAQFAHAGRPLLGDSQYGDREVNRRYRREYQALYAYRVAFPFEGDAAPLDKLAGRAFEVKDVPFAREYFPGKGE